MRYGSKVRVLECGMNLVRNGSRRLKGGFGVVMIGISSLSGSGVGGLLVSHVRPLYILVGSIQIRIELT